MQNQSNVTRRTINLSYDPINQLHHLTFDALVPAAGDLFLTLRPQADGVIECSGMVAIKNAFVSANDIRRVLRIAVGEGRCALPNDGRKEPRAHRNAAGRPRPKD